MLSQLMILEFKKGLVNLRALIITAQPVKYVLNGDFSVFVSYRDSIKISYEPIMWIGALNEAIRFIISTLHKPKFRAYGGNY